MLDFKSFHGNLAVFHTPKPLCFISKYEGKWTVFTLRDYSYRKYQEQAYYVNHYYSYRSAKQGFLVDSAFFDRYPEIYGNWPVK